MYVNLRCGESEQIFSFWGYGETAKLSPGSGLFVAKTGVSYNHHFVLSVQYEGYQFVAGDYSVDVFARVVGTKAPIKLANISLSVSKGQAKELSRQLGILYELEWNGKDYVGHTQEYKSSSDIM